MKIKYCRSCSSKSLKYISTLGNQYLTGIFLSKVNQKIPKGVLTMVLCEKCSLLQLENSFDANIMYGDNYGYLSSLNLHMVKHLRLKSDKLKKMAQLKKGDIIIDIGSNDGTSLRNYSTNFILIGVDPTIKKLKNLYRSDIITVSDFFTKNSVSGFLKKKKLKLLQLYQCFMIYFRRLILHKIYMNVWMIKEYGI